MVGNCCTVENKRRIVLSKKAYFGKFFFPEKKMMFKEINSISKKHLSGLVILNGSENQTLNKKYRDLLKSGFGQVGSTEIKFEGFR